MATRTSRRARVIAFDGGGRLQAGQHDSSLHVKEALQRVGLLDVEDEKGQPSNDGAGYYVLGMNRHNFLNTEIREAGLHTDHRMVWAVLQGEGALWNRSYLQRSKLWLIKTWTVQPHLEGGA